MVVCIEVNEKYMISGSEDQTIRIWKHGESEATRVLCGHKGTVNCINFNDSLIVSGSDDGTIIFWSLADGAIL